jgi:uncharacterized protein
MSAPFVAGVGAVLSADVAVPDHPREVRFYSRVLCTGAEPLWREEDLTNNLGVPIIGLGKRTAEYAHLPLQWMPHVQVTDVAAGVQRALDAGGSVLMQAPAGDGAASWAVLQDPGGAAFGLVPVVPADALPPADAAPSPEMARPMGRIAWLDLTVPDAPAARDFYRRVVGWSVREVAMQEGEQRYADYEMLGEDGTATAGVCHARGVNAGLPPVWMIYLPVDDLAESLRRVADGGGEVVRTARGGTGDLAYAAIRDPVGAYLALIPGRG